MRKNRPPALKRRRDHALKAALVAAGVFAMSVFGSGMAIAAKPAVNCNGVFNGATPSDPITKTADKTTAIPGETVTYTFTWHSTGVELAEVVDCFRVDDGSNDTLNALVEVSNAVVTVPNVGLPGSLQSTQLVVQIPNDASLIGHTVYDRAKLTKGNAESRSDILGVQVVAPPTLNLAPSVSCPTMTPDGLDVGLVANASDSDGTITNYHWVFGDGSTADTATGSTSHTYAADGTYNVSVTVTDDDGATASAGPCPVTVAAVVIPPVNVAPTVSCPTMTIAGLAVDLSALGVDTDGTITNYHWVFGDGSTADTATGSVSHTYAADGSYNVSVTVTDNDGDTGSAGPCPATVAAIVIPPVNLAPAVTCPTMSATGLLAAFSATGSDADGTIVGYSWSFGDGSVLDTATGSATHTYAASGSYDVYVMVTDDDGETATAGPCPSTVAAAPVIVDDPPPVDDDDTPGSTPVGPVILPRRVELPKTGADARSLFMLAGLLMLAGGAMRFVRPMPIRVVYAGQGSVAAMVEQFGLSLLINARSVRNYATRKM